MATHSGKKRKHTFTKLIAVSLYGHLYFVSESEVGSMNDISVYNLTGNCLHGNLKDDEWLMADSTGLLSRFERIIVPIHGQWNELNVDERKYNASVATVRTLVENVNREFKKFKICSSIYRSHTSCLEDAKKEHHMIWIVVGGLIKEYIGQLRK